MPKREPTPSEAFRRFEKLAARVVRVRKDVDKKEAEDAQEARLSG